MPDVWAFRHSGGGTERGKLPVALGREAGTLFSYHKSDSGDCDLSQALWDLWPQSPHLQTGLMLSEPRCAVRFLGNVGEG